MTQSLTIKIDTNLLIFFDGEYLPIKKGFVEQFAKHWVSTLDNFGEVDERLKIRFSGSLMIDPQYFKEVRTPKTLIVK